MELIDTNSVASFFLSAPSTRPSPPVVFTPLVSLRVAAPFLFSINTLFKSIFPTFEFAIGRDVE